MEILTNESDATRTRVRLTVLKSTTLCRSGLGRFAVDFQTTRAIREKVALDYNHDDAEIVGYVESFQFGADGISAVGTILARDGADSRANELIFNLRGGVPYEVSPLLDLSAATVERLNDGETGVVNGATVEGPLDIYRGATIRGVAICPHGTDGETATIAFSASRETNETKTKEKSTMADEENKTNDAEPKKCVNEELEQLIAEFGKERGVDYYLAGTSLDDARRDDYEQLKAARLAAESDEKKPDEKDGDANACDENGAKAPENAKPDDEKKELAALRATVEKQGKELAALRASVRRGDELGVTEPTDGGARPTAKPTNPLIAAADKFKKNGVVRLNR